MSRIAYTVTVPVTVVSEANQREHWAVRRKRKERQQMAVAAFVRRHLLPPLPVVVTMTRLYAGRQKAMDKGDNLEGSMKHVRDEIARIYGVDDGSPLYTWRVDQQRGDATGVRITVEPREAICGADVPGGIGAHPTPSASVAPPKRLAAGQPCGGVDLGAAAGASARVDRFSRRG